MKTRLYNEFGAAIGPDTDYIINLTFDFIDNVMTYAKEHNLDLRDVESVVLSNCNCQLAYHILKEAIRIRSNKNKNIKQEISDKEQLRLIKGNFGYICPNCLVSRDASFAIDEHANWCAIKRETE